MDIRKFLSKGVSLKKQAPGWPEDGPISPCLRKLAGTIQAESSDAMGIQSISAVGADLARIYAGRSLRVLFVDTGGAALLPGVA